MSRKLLALVALLVAQTVALEVRSATLCAAGNPNAGLIESTPTSAFIDNGNGTVTHSLTGLMWKHCVQGLSGAGCAGGTATAMPWSAALATAATDMSAGYRDWRLPNGKELESIVEDCGYTPSMNQVAFPATPASPFWSGSTYAPAQAFAWSVSFNDGYTFARPKSTGSYVRLVRGGQSFGSFDARGTFDVDGDGRVDALTDGLILIRHMFGLRGPALTAGAIGTGATRTAAEIEAYIQSVMP